MIETTASIVGLILAFAGILAALWAVGRVKGMEASITILNEANSGLRDANADLTLRLMESERICAERISNLEGQNLILAQGLGDTLVTSISDHLERALDRIVNRALERLEAKGI
jgi:hypothetical protein